MFQLELLEGWIIYNVFNKDLLTRCREPHFKEQHIDLVSQPIIINKEKEYKVEEVRKHRKQGWRTQYLVYQKGYRNEHNQQITEKRLSYVKEVIEDYWKKISSQNL